ncbi:hypothetical protein F5879DRAFT_927222 [Lentinula edodes]|nr:hypothetical protein F5879DRAFT_927222 [Lentinula edodes]
MSEPTTPSRSSFSAKRPCTPHSIYRDCEILVALIEKYVKAQKAAGLSRARYLTQPKAHDVVASPLQRKISLIWISSEDEADCPDDSEDSDGSSGGWVPQSATEVSSDEDEPLAGLGGVTAAEARIQKAGKSIEKMYLVYHGRNNSEGLYFKWQGTKGATGALELTDQFPDTVYKLFNNQKLAAKAYKEYIFKSPVQAKEHLIIVKGDNPGVYN